MINQNEVEAEKARLSQQGVQFSGEWSDAEIARIAALLSRLESITNASLPVLFRGQVTTFHKSDLPGKAGRTRGGSVELDQNWSEWTLAHELGHRWDHAWDRQPRNTLRKSLGAGRWDWIKRPLRRWERRVETLLRRAGFKVRIDWPALWYHPGKAEPACGVDRNFNSGEDLAECFAAMVLPEQAKKRAITASQKPRPKNKQWNWAKVYGNYQDTPRGQLIQNELQQVAEDQSQTSYRA